MSGPSSDDPLGPSRGCAIGLALGSALWIIAGLLAYALKRASEWWR